MAAEVEQDAWSVAWTSAWEPQPVAQPREVKSEANAPPGITEIFDRHGAWIDAAVEQFEKALGPIVAKAQESLIAYLRSVLEFRGEDILPTAGNQAILEQIDALFMRELKAAGYDALGVNFTGQFTDQFPFLQQIIDQISSQSGHKFPPVSFLPEQLRVLQSNAIAEIQAGIRSIGGAAIAQIAVQRSLFGLAGLPFQETVKVFQKEFGGSVRRNTLRAETAVSVWYRQVTDLQYQKIEKEIPNLAQRYVYSGPLDQVTRPFCRHMLTVTAKQALSRDEIDNLDNGQLPNVWVSGGGFGCRHIWLLHVPAATAAAA